MKRICELKVYYDNLKLNPNLKVTALSAIFAHGFIFLMNIFICSTKNNTPSIICTILTGIVFAFSAIFVLIKRSKLHTNYVVFTTTSSSMLLTLILSIVNISISLTKLSPWVYIIITIISMLVGSITNYIVAILYTHKKNINIPKTKIIYAGSAVGFLASILTSLWIKTSKPSPETLILLLWIIVPFISSFAGYKFFSVVCKYYLDKKYVKKQ